MPRNNSGYLPPPPSEASDFRTYAQSYGVPSAPDWGVMDPTVAGFTTQDTDYLNHAMDLSTAPAFSAEPVHRANRYRSTKETTVAVDKATFDTVIYLAIKSIDNSKKNCLELYKNCLDSVERNDYTAPYASSRYAAVELTFLLHAQPQLQALQEQGLVSRDMILLQKIEELARQKYDVEYSKYAFYPRLKKAVNYGNAELLANILRITQISKGKIACQK